jgi:hypothetical protein
MPFEPDIVVTNPGDSRVTLVVDAKIALPDLQQTELGLKIYMCLLQCPTGLLVTPDRMWLYQDRYTSRSPESVELVDSFNLKPVWEDPPTQETRFETFVQHWLEDLPGQPAEHLPKELRNAVREYILPAVVHGDVRAAHPR